MEIAGQARHVSPAVGDYALEAIDDMRARCERLERVAQAMADYDVMDWLQFIGKHGEFEEALRTGGIVRAFGNAARAALEGK